MPVINCNSSVPKYIFIDFHSNLSIAVTNNLQQYLKAHPLGSCKTEKSQDNRPSNLCDMLKVLVKLVIELSITLSTTRVNIYSSSRHSINMSAHFLWGVITLLSHFQPSNHDPHTPDRHTPQ